MKIIGLIAENWNEAQDWIDKNFGWEGGNVSFTHNSVRWDGLEIRYIDNMKQAYGLKLLSIIKVGGWRKSWRAAELAVLETRIRT